MSESQHKTRNAKRIRDLVFLAVLTGIVLVSMSLSSVDPAALIAGISYSISLISEMYPPNFSNLPYLLSLTAETIAMGAVATVLGTIISLPLGFLAARNTTTGPLTYFISRSVVSVFRTIPDLVFGLIFVVAFGMGPLAGILAITLATVGMLGKFYSESIESIDPKPVEALQATGSHRLGVIRHAVMPQVFPMFMGYNFYMLDSNIRSALAIGIVGAGGLGIELYVQMEQFHFQKVATILIITIFLVALINRVSVYLRKGFIDGTLMKGSRKSLDTFLIIAIPAIAIVCIYVTQIDFSSIPKGILNIISLSGMFFPPNFTYLGYDLGLMFQTIAMGITGTVFAIVLAVPLGMLAARNVMKNSILHNVVRECMNFVRAMPEIMLALVFVAAVGLGPFAGVLALAIHTTGILGEFYAESIENIDPKPVEAVEATGARLTQRIRHAIFPQIVPIFNSHNLYILDRNIRASTIMGIVGAGGIGFELLESMRLYNYTHTAEIILIILVTILLVDTLSAYLRKKVV